LKKPRKSSQQQAKQDPDDDNDDDEAASQPHPWQRSIPRKSCAYYQANVACRIIFHHSCVRTSFRYPGLKKIQKEVRRPFQFFLSSFPPFIKRDEKNHHAILEELQDSFSSKVDNHDSPPLRL
jgi:hypothetical protein